MSLKPAIVEAATRLFAQKGYNGTSIALIAKAAGAAEGTIFHHFRNKEELLKEVINTARDRIIDAVEEEILTPVFPNGLARAEEVVRLYFALSETMKWEFPLLFRNDSQAYRRMDEAWRESLEKIYSCFLNAIAESIDMGKRDGSIVPHISPTNTAFLIFAMINGLNRFDASNLFPVEALFSDVMANVRKMLTY